MESTIGNRKKKWWKKGKKTYGGKARKRSKKKLKGEMEMRQKEELYQSQQEIMPLRDLSTVEMACIEYTLSVQQHPAFHGDKCHMSLLTLDKGSVYQRCQPAGPAGLSLTFITALSKRSPRIFLYFATPSSETLPLFPAHSPCSPQCFLALSLKKTMSSRNKTVWFIQPRRDSLGLDSSKQGSQKGWKTCKNHGNVKIIEKKLPKP